VTLADGLPCVQAKVDIDALLRNCGVALGEGALDGDGATQGPTGAGECDHEAVALGLDLVAPMGCHLAAHDLVVRRQQLAGPDVATLDQASHLLLQTLATNRHPAHDRKGAHPDSWGARGRGDVADPEVLAAHDGDAGQVHLDALGHDYVDPAHEGHGGDDDLRTV